MLILRVFPHDTLPSRPLPLWHNVTFRMVRIENDRDDIDLRKCRYFDIDIFFPSGFDNIGTPTSVFSFFF